MGFLSKYKFLILALLVLLSGAAYGLAQQPVTVANIVTVIQGTANSLVNAWPVKVTDGTNTMPTGDASARTIHTTVDNASVAVTGTFWQTTQPVSGTVTANQGAAPWSNNITQFGGTNLSTGTGAGGAGIPRVTVSNDSNVLATQSGTWTVQPGNTANSTPWLTTDSATSATGSAVPSKASYVAGNGSGNQTAMTVCDNWTPINQTTGTQLFAGTSAKKTYICAIHLVTAITQNIALVGGTGTVCATSPHAIAGGTTAATGWNFGANGGIVAGNGIGVIMQAGTAADNVCLLQSGSGQISGTIAWTQY